MGTKIDSAASLAANHCHAAAEVATKITYTAAGGSFLFGMTSSEWAIIGIVASILLGSFTFAVNWYYKHKTFELNRKKRLNGRGDE